MLRHADSLTNSGPLNVRDVVAPPEPFPAPEAAPAAPVTPLASVEVGGKTLWTDPRA